MIEMQNWTLWLLSAIAQWLGTPPIIYLFSIACLALLIKPVAALIKSFVK